MTDLFTWIFILMFVGACLICTSNYYAVVAGLGLVAIAICLCIYAVTDGLEETLDAKFEEV